MREYNKTGIYNIEAPSYICCSGKAISITYREFCVCSLKYPACNVQVSSVACSAVQYFSALSDKRHEIPKQTIGHKMCFNFL
jgi:hypothetical protein